MDIRILIFLSILVASGIFYLSRIIASKNSEIEELRKQKELFASQELEEIKKQQVHIDEYLEEYRNNRICEIDEYCELQKKNRNLELDVALEEIEEAFYKEKVALEEDIENLRQIFADFKNRNSAINEAILREQRILDAENFYRIALTKADIEDIVLLEEIAPRFNNPVLLGRLIFDVYAKRPMGEMIKRILSNRIGVSGIYKITYLTTGEAYIGKSVDIGKRWGEHIKATLGIGTIASSSLHVKMREKGFWNFSFEVLEEVPREELAAKEKFYIELYSTDSQLNMRKGG